MCRSLVFCLMFSLTALSGLAQTDLPTFSKFPAKTEQARARSVVIASDPQARMYRTRLREAFRRGPNFAGRYILATWGCGTGCISGAIIDGRTGRVYWPEELVAFGVGYTDATFPENPLEFRRNSRLLILRGIPGMNEAEDESAADKPSGDHYFEWQDGKLKLLRFVPKPD
ncbi:MAG TPA: hypothetical protein PKD11_15770 [Pyrinomonadaceae bacterium]|nr:hypothetical protein [Pyrinomonadaceae bacterium]